MIYLRHRFITLLISCLFVVPVPGYAAMNFAGAIVDFKDVSTSVWRFGVLGNKWIVSIVNDKSLAKQIGLKQGDIILSLDEKDVISINDLTELTEGKHKLKVFNKRNEIDNLEINIVPKKNVSSKQDSFDSNVPLIVVNDEVLAGKYGKSEPNDRKKKRSYQECMDDELANANTYEYFLNKPNSRGGDYGRAQRICDEEFGKRTGVSIERLY